MSTKDVRRGDQGDRSKGRDKAIVMGTIYHCMKGFFIILDIGCSMILQRQTVFFYECALYFQSPQYLASY